MDNGDEPGFGSYALVGFVLGAITGTVLEAGIGNTFYGFWRGAFAGLALGCFIYIAMTVVRNQNKKKQHK
jgi:cytosine/uracil/thiamine/allantoin permease